MGFLERDKDAPRYKGQGQAETGEIIEEVSPGEIVDLPPGVKFTPFDPGHGPETYTNFRKNVLRSVSAGLGISYNTLANDLESVNYSSARFGRDIELETWRMLQGEFAEGVLQPIFNAWLEQSVLAGALEGVTLDQIELIQNSIKWRGRGWEYIDPSKDLQGAAGSIDMGLSTRRRELEEKGLEYEEVLDDLAYEKELEAEKGLSFVNPFSRHPEVEPEQEGESPDTADTGKPGAAPAAPAGKPKNGKKPINGSKKPAAVKRSMGRNRLIDI
jgi:lambda family phage portal protein